MVQFFRGGPSRSALWSQMLGEAAGQGLGSLLGTYQTNKALEDVINNPQYKESSPGERMGALQSALGRFGERGQKVLQQRLMAEQQLQQEDEQKVLADIQSGKEVSNEKLAKISPQNQFKAWELKRKKQFGKNIKENLIKAGYSDETASLWQQQFESSPQGGETDVIKNVNDMLKRSPAGRGLSGSAAKDIPEEVPQMEGGQIPNDFQWPEFNTIPEGYTTKEWNDERKTWRKENAPIYEEIKTKLKNDEMTELSTKNLTRLNESKKLPEGFERTLINPDTGEFYGLAQLAQIPSVESQEWVKEIARFQNRAKDAFGSRVTNFDLQTYMKQFPGLLNSQEGRKRILEMMAINNKLDLLYDRAINQVYQHYGLSGISQEDAERLARSFIKDETTSLKEEYLKNDDYLKSSGINQLSGKMIDVIGPDGQIYEVDQSEISKLPEGYKVK